MACYRPLQAYRLASGKVIFKKDLSSFSIEIKLPCGQCIGCRLENSRQKAVRCMHEASLYEDNCFITLTYDTDHLPPNLSLNKKHFQDFMKRLRSHVSYNYPDKLISNIRYIHCGEYGNKFGRPHYHACLFNFDFTDKTVWKQSNGMNLYRSKLLEQLWPFGYSSIGTLTFESAAYCSRYILKKVTGEKSESHYRIVDDNGEVLGYRQPEYNTMSLKPGIGKRWIDNFMEDTYKDDSVVVRGRKTRPPRYYDSQFEVFDPDAFRTVKSNRKLLAKKYISDNTPDRLIVKEKCKLAEIKKLTRVVDDSN